MSLDYNFRIVTPLPAESVLAIICEALALKRRAYSTPQEEGEDVEGPGFLLAAGPVAPEIQEMMEEGLGFSPSVDLQFWVDADQRHVAVTALLGGVLAVLRQVPGDAVLLFGGGSVLLLRRAGRLHLDSRTGVWTPERLALTDAPYEMQALPTL